MRRSALILAFAVASLIGLVAFLPLRLAVGPAAGIGLSADAVTGSVWSGRAVNASLSGTPLGDLRLGLDPLALVRGGLGMRLRANGAFEGEGTFWLAGGRGVDRLNGSAPLDALAIRTPFDARVIFENATLLLGPKSCRSASGVVRAEAVVARLGGAVWQGPNLAGDLACTEDGAATATLKGADGRGSITMFVRLFADGRYAVETRIAANDPTLGLALPLAGFAPGPDGYQRLEEGRFDAAPP